ncbi:hypothetical protein L208DRAFT_1548374 [Tricholoma matsutake]|nr:hypothetical protein L208DRAFT_1548374 [Tricholoma matsutake 945]
MLVINSMHCILEGIVHYHCRSVLRLSAKQAAVPDPILPAFSYHWTDYSSDAPEEYCVKNDREIQHIFDLHKILSLPLAITTIADNVIDESQLKMKLLSKNLQPLKFVCYTLNLPMVIISLPSPPVPTKMKDHFAQLLIKWRLSMPLMSGDIIAKTVTPETIQHIQHVIYTIMDQLCSHKLWRGQCWHD